MQCYVFHRLFFMLLTTFCIMNVIAVTAPYHELILLWEGMGRNFWIHSLGAH